MARLEAPGHVFHSYKRKQFPRNKLEVIEPRFLQNSALLCRVACELSVSALTRVR
jgi:hypothetical protein